jgi:hypothetical protein
VALDRPLAHHFDHPLARAALEEVLGLHVFLEAWLGGTIADAPAMFARLESALADSFTQVTPGGARLSRADVIGALRGAHGTRAGAGAFRITIREPELAGRSCRPALARPARDLDRDLNRRIAPGP